jgi:hypothetical protein
MKGNATRLALLLILAALFGCAQEGSREGAGESTGFGKADTEEEFHTDALPESALVALGLEDRFLIEGDSWQLAWMFRNDDSSHRDGKEQLGNATYQPPTLVSFEVTDTGEIRYGRTTRRTATVSVAGDHFGPAAIQALVAPPFQTVDTQIDYRVNDLFNPVSKRYHGVDEKGVPTTRLVALDGRANLTMQFDSLPNGYPNLDRITPRPACDDEFYANVENPAWDEYTACWGDAPALPAALLALAPAAGIDTAAPGLHIKATDAQPDYVFWRTGDLYPTYVSGPRGYGLLVDQARAE